jgi:hypothetical protein
MKEYITPKKYAKLKKVSKNSVYKKIRTIEKWKSELSELETKSFCSGNLDNELKMVKLRHKIKNSINYYKEDRHIFVLVD